MARKKKGLPFVVQPRLEPVIEQIGNEECGIIEIERRGYLTVAEKAITQGGLNGDTTVRKLYALAGRIGRETGRQQSEVSNDLMQPERPEYLTPYDDEITECIMEMMAFQERISIIQATALIMSRIDNTWTVDQTMELNPDLVAALSTFFGEEESKTTEALEASSEDTPAVEGKS